MLSKGEITPCQRQRRCGDHRRVSKQFVQQHRQRQLRRQHFVSHGLRRPRQQLRPVSSELLGGEPRFASVVSLPVRVATSRKLAGFITLPGQILVRSREANAHVHNRRRRDHGSGSADRPYGRPAAPAWPGSARGLSDVLLPHQVADFIGLPEREIWEMVRARKFPMPGLICSSNRVTRLPCWSRDEVADWLRARARPRLQRPQ